jgi:hypothetical protein
MILLILKRIDIFLVSFPDYTFLITNWTFSKKIFIPEAFAVWA